MMGAIYILIFIFGLLLGSFLAGRIQDLIAFQDLFTFFSLSCFATSIYFYKKLLINIIGRILFILSSFCILVFYLFYAIADYFTADGINEAVIYHLQYGLAGAGFSEYQNIYVISFFYIILTLIFLIWLSRNKNVSVARPVYFYLAFLFLFVSFAFNPATVNILKSYMERKSALASDNFDEFYNKPNIKQIGESKNLVFIYAEGLERTYFDEEIFPGLIKELKRLESRSTYFRDIRGLDELNSTIAGMVASQCGIPLPSINSNHNSASFWTDNYLPGAICIGDLLSQEGYYLSYYGGARLTFAGKDKFYSTHKFDEIFGYDELAAETDKSYKNTWGLYDDTLFDLSYDRFEQLAEEKDKFALFLLTMDTHHPAGYISKSCAEKRYLDGKNDILNAVGCSDQLIVDFVNKILQSPYAENTIIVIASDHITHTNTAASLLKKGEQRNLFMVIEPEEVAREVDKTGSVLDVGSTVLPFLGYEGTVGLGRNLLNSNQSNSEIEIIQKNLPYWRNPVARFWDYSQIKESIRIYPSANAVAVDNSTYPLPALIRLDKDLRTSIILGSDHIAKILLTEMDNSPYLLIDKFKEGGEEKYFLITGQGEERYEKIELSQDAEFSAEKINQLFKF